MKKLIILSGLIIILSFLNSFSQPVLKPHIGLNSIPADTDTMCYFPVYIDPGGYTAPGYQVGDTVNDFTLFSFNGDTLNLRNELLKGKPVVLVSGSYTCPVFRNKINSLNSLVAEYGDSVSFFVIYCIEAHPYPDISPYFGYVNVGQQNINEGIIFPQPRTYGERKTMVYRLDSARDISASVFIDGPCNEWLLHYGPAPNNAYLINTNGTVFAKHGWFNRPPEDMADDIDSLLYGASGGGGGSSNGLFNFQYTADSLVTGPPGETLYGHGEFINVSDSGVYIKIVRDLEDLPVGWASSICIDVCLPPETDTVTFYLAPRDTQSYTMYFYTTAEPGFGRIRMRFGNVNNAANRFTKNFLCRTDSSLTSINPNNTIIPQEFYLKQNYPNPFNPSTNLEFGISKLGFVSLKVYDVLGNEVATLVNENLHPGNYNYQLSTVNYQLPSGVYFYRLTTEGFTDTKRMLLIK